MGKKIEKTNGLIIRTGMRVTERNISSKSLNGQPLAVVPDQMSPSRRVTAVTFKGKGLSKEFEGASWDEIRRSIHGYSS